jgi:hypothetical protein
MTLILSFQGSSRPFNSKGLRPRSIGRPSAPSVAFSQFRDKRLRSLQKKPRAVNASHQKDSTRYAVFSWVVVSCPEQLISWEVSVYCSRCSQVTYSKRRCLFCALRLDDQVMLLLALVGHNSCRRMCISEFVSWHENILACQRQDRRRDTE